MCNIKITLTLETESVRIQSEKQATCIQARLYSARIPTRYIVLVISRNKADFFLIGTVVYSSLFAIHAGF